MINVYHLENSRSFRIVWLLEELNVPYELHKFKRINGVAGDDFRAACGSPMAKSPVIRDGELTIIESGAIAQYLIRKYGKRLTPASEIEQIRNDEWFQFSEGTIMTHAIAMLYARWTLTKIPHEPATLLPEVVTRLTPNIHKDLNHVERSLEGEGREYLVREKELMAADVLVAWSVDWIWEKKLGVEGIDLAARWPLTHAFLERSKARKAYKIALEKTDDDLTRNV